jgi:hypothetical protein
MTLRNHKVATDFPDFLLHFRFMAVLPAISCAEKSIEPEISNCTVSANSGSSAAGHAKPAHHIHGLRGQRAIRGTVALMRFSNLSC